MAKKKAKKAKAKPKTKKVRLYFRPSRPPKWWPRVDVDGKPGFVGVTCKGFGWAIGDGDKFTEGEIEEVKDEIRCDYGLRTRFLVKAA